MDRLEKLYNSIVSPDSYSEENVGQSIAAEPEINYDYEKNQL